MESFVLYELQETELWDDRWWTIGLFESPEEAEEFKLSRKKKLKKHFKGDENEFNDYYRFIITKRAFYKKATPKNIKNILSNLKDTVEVKPEDLGRYVKNVKKLVDYIYSSKLTPYEGTGA